VCGPRKDGRKEAVLVRPGGAAGAVTHARPFSRGAANGSGSEREATTDSNHAGVPKRKTFCVCSGSRLEVEVSTLLVRPPALVALAHASQPVTPYNQPTPFQTTAPPHFPPPIKQMPFVVSS